MKLQNLIHRLRNENSLIGDTTREIENDQSYNSYNDESKLKQYLKKRMLDKGMLNGFTEILAIHELINSNEEKEVLL